jgi:hypothetical protein
MASDITDARGAVRSVPILFGSVADASGAVALHLTGVGGPRLGKIGATLCFAGSRGGEIRLLSDARPR